MRRLKSTAEKQRYRISTWTGDTEDCVDLSVFSMIQCCGVKPGQILSALSKASRPLQVM